ncbi:MAG: recombinase family protein [Phycisphaeraceae bacterium]|nr:recombinase family protein [Phycisphaeraceae bacterium]
MVSLANPKVQPEHLKRNAYLYIRQSTARQVLEHQESTKRQYALESRARELGWSPDRIIVIDSDLGQSGVSAADRKGFQRLITEVTMDNAGIVLGLEVSRLARNSADWHRLLEICSLTNTLILDEDGLYDPCDFNDRLLLGLKGTFSEAELHMISSRLRGGVINKAKRGELKMCLPTGFVYDNDNNIVLDPDKQVQGTIHHFFETFRRTGSSMAVLKCFQKEGVLFPRRLRDKARKGELAWEPLGHSRAMNILHNPHYAGAYAYGKSRYRKCMDGHMSCKRRDKSEWLVLLKDFHEEYISWEQYEENERQLMTWYLARSGGCQKTTPPREGPALLQGLAICGICGNRMAVEYRNSYGRQNVPSYACRYAHLSYGHQLCQSFVGYEVDKAIAELIKEAVTPMALQVTLKVHREMQQRFEERDKIRRLQVDRAQYEADLAQRRYMQVDPENRLVAETLEEDWNEKLVALNGAKQDFERLHRADQLIIGKQHQAEILALASDFPKLWQNPNISNCDRKRMIRLVIEDVTMIKGDKTITMHVRFRGGATKTINAPKPLPYCEKIKTDPELIRQIDQLLDHHVTHEIADILSQRGFKTGTGKQLTGELVYHMQHNNRIQSRFQRLRKRGLLTQKEVAKLLGTSENNVWCWRTRGWLSGHVFNDKNQYLFEPIDNNHPIWQRVHKINKP